MAEADDYPCARRLRAGGFKPIGRWVIDAATDLPRIDGTIPRTAGIYAHLVDGQVMYVGSAQRGLHLRMRRYETSRMMRTSQRVREAATSAIASGKRVDVWALMPSVRELSLDGLPLDLICGIEEGLIRMLRPAWNRRGLG